MGNSDEGAWRELCDAALLEVNPTRLVERIHVARIAIFDRMHEGVSKPPTSEQVAMRDALTVIDSLAKIAKRDLAEPKQQ
jgi:hypothetical protein